MERGLKLIFENEWTITFWETAHFLRKKPFVLLFAYLFVDFGFSFLPLKYFIYFKRRSFRSEIVAKFVLLKKLIFHHSHFFSICRVSTFKVYAEGKSFRDYSLIIVAEIYIIFRSELIQQMNSGPYSLGTDGSNDESSIKNWILFCFGCLMITKGKSLISS